VPAPNPAVDGYKNPENSSYSSFR
jgi:hypothetical protein